MADIDDVMDKLGDILDKIADNKEKINEVLAKDEIWKICGTCKGAKELYDYGITPTGHEPILKPCLECNGIGKIKWGNTDTPV